MSKITTIYNQIITELGTLYSDRTKIPNVYSLTDNNSIFLRNGYGLKVNASNPEESEFCNYAYSVLFAVVLTKEVLRLDSDSEQIDNTSILLLEDSKTLQDLFLKYDQLSIDSSIDKIDFSGTTGIEFLEADKFNFATFEVAFTITLRENL